MPVYALLILPSSNRVYAASSAALTLAELKLFSDTVLDGRLASLSTTLIGGVRYVTFSGDRLEDRDVAYLSNLSSIYALFEVTDGALRPELEVMDSGPYLRFGHRVDQAINRDILVARKPSDTI